MTEKPKGLSDDELIELIMKATGVDEQTARFILALERGEIKGDIIELKPGEKPEDEE